MLTDQEVKELLATLKDLEQSTPILPQPGIDLKLNATGSFNKENLLLM